jgi:hypothetical protein
MTDTWADQLSGEHAPHRGNHDGYACGFSGPHCWECGEPWPCRSERGVTDGPIIDAHHRCIPDETTLACEDPEEPCDADGRDEHRWCDNCIARSVLARLGGVLR